MHQKHGVEEQLCSSTNILFFYIFFKPECGYNGDVMP